MGLFKFTWWNTIDTLRLLLSKQIRLEMKIGEKIFRVQNISMNTCTYMHSIVYIRNKVPV